MVNPSAALPVLGSPLLFPAPLVKDELLQICNNSLSHISPPRRRSTSTLPVGSGRHARNQFTTEVTFLELRSSVSGVRSSTERNSARILMAPLTLTL